MWNLDQQSRPVAGFRITTAGATMRQVNQYLNALLNDLVALLTANAGDKADAACVVLVRRIIKTLRRRQTVVCLPVSQRYLRGKRRWSFVVGRSSLAKPPPGKASFVVFVLTRFCQRPMTNSQ